MTTDKKVKTEMGYIEAEASKAEPDWGSGGRVHNWRNYVGERTRALWPALTENARIAIALDAGDLASREDWE